MFVLISSVVLFWLVSRNSSFLDIDSGPYLSMAYNLATSGMPTSSFNFVGNFAVLPSYPNFIPPGFGVLVGLGTVLTGSLLMDGKAVLAVSLFLAHFFAYLIVARVTGQRVYALAASALVVWHPALALWATRVLSELPFIACLLGAVAASAVVMGGMGTRPAWALLVTASALLPLLRYVGIFFPLTFSAVYLARALRISGSGRVVLSLLAYNLAVFTPLALWSVLVSLGGSSLYPDRPASQLVVGDALLDAIAYLVRWLGPWLVAFALPFALLRIRRPHTDLPEVRGMSWYRTKANPLLKLRLLKLNGQWEQYWKARQDATARYAA